MAGLPRPDMYNVPPSPMLDGKQKNTREQVCRTCCPKKVVASHFCFQCRESLCLSCYMKHARAQIFEGHITDAITRVVFCQKHSTQAATVYCLDCSGMICPRCCVKKHEGHNTDEVKTIAERGKKEIKNYFEQQAQYQSRKDKADQCISELRENSKAKGELLTEMLKNVTMFQNELIKHKTKMEQVNEFNICNVEFFSAELNTNSPHIQLNIDVSNLHDLEQLSHPRFLERTQGKFGINTFTTKLPGSPRKVPMPEVGEICSRTLLEIHKLFQKLSGRSADTAFIGTDCVDLTAGGDGSGDFIQKNKQFQPVPKPRHHKDRSKMIASPMIGPFGTEEKRKACDTPMEVEGRPAVRQRLASRMSVPVGIEEKREACQTPMEVEERPKVPQSNAMIVGNQPPGTMTCDVFEERIDGYPDAKGSLIINYVFPNGIQGANHPRPGFPFHGLRKTAFLPDNPEGGKVLELLKRAFKAKLVFTIRRSTITGKEDWVTFNHIHHKSNLDGGPANFGYPDPTYLSHVKDELAAKGIK